MKNKEKPENTVSADVLADGMDGKKKGSKVASTIINVILVIAIIIAALCTYVSFVTTSGNGFPSIFGIRPFSVQTESMFPTLKPGDLIIDTAVKDTSTLRVNDIITYWTVIDGERVLNTHRIIEIYDGGGFLIFQTQGDNNTSADPLTVHESEIAGKYKLRIGGLGKVFDYLQTSTGFLLVVVVPVLLFFVYHLIQFFRVLFEYQNVKNRLRYEQERGTAEDLIEKEKQSEKEKEEKTRAEIEAEMREKLKAELLAEMQSKKSDDAKPQADDKAEEKPEEAKEEATDTEAPAAEETPSAETDEEDK